MWEVAARARRTDDATAPRCSAGDSGGGRGVALKLKMVGATASEPPSACRKALDFYWGNYLPLMMIFVVFFGYFVPAPGG